MKLLPAFLFVIVTVAGVLASDDAPWLAPRSMNDFQVHLKRSPFSLPTAEESAPMADRFFLTGAATINNEAVVFVLDKNSQTRHMLGLKADSSNNQLLEFNADANPKNMSARIRMEGQETTIRYAELPSEGQPPTPVPMNAMTPIPPGAPAPAQQPPGSPTAQPGAPNPDEPPRRVIRRRFISGQPPVAQPVPNQ